MTYEIIDPLLSKAKLEELGITYSRQHLWELERAGRFPQRVVLGRQIHAWRQSEIAAWLEQRVRRKLTPPKPKAAEQGAHP